MKKRERKRGPGKIRGWKGLLASEDRLFKIMTTVVLVVFIAALTFTQLGFIGINLGSGLNCYVMALLVPVAFSALMFGRRAGLCMGLYAGTVQLFHAVVQPLDLYEAYFVTTFTSIVLYAVMGYLFGLLFAVALRNNPKGVWRYVRIGIACFFVSTVASVAFAMGVIIDMLLAVLSEAQSTGRADWPVSALQAAYHVGNMSAQCLLDFLLTTVVCSVADVGMRAYSRTKHDQSLHTVFRGWLSVVVFLAFMVTSAIGFVSTTMQGKQTARERMDGEIEYLDGQIQMRLSMASDVHAVISAYNIPDEESALLDNNLDLKKLFEGYTLPEDGTVLLAKDGVVECSDNPRIPVGTKLSEIYGTSILKTFDDISETGELFSAVYDVRVQNTETLLSAVKGDGNDIDEPESLTQIGYLRAGKTVEGRTIIIIQPSSMVFASRTETMVWTATSAFVLLAVVFVLTDGLLKRIVVRGIDQTNESLAKITSGHLDERVEVRDNREFQSLSSGINATVDALEGWIAEAETRMERELATAKAIQESALPRTFPPFPEIEAFDIYASMNAAKEVGGDFYNFFLIDDHTVGFLIADVSGKGIPGALFMMAAKTELENYLSTGMDVDQAILSANRALCAKNDAGMFVTVWAATLDYTTGELNYVNAGHNFPLLRHNGSWQWLKKKCGLFLGTFETAKYRKETLVLEEGDEILLYTDGVNEAFNVDEEEFGNDRLEAFLGEHTDLHPQDIVGELRTEVATWAKGAEQSDDITILALEYGKPPEATGTITIPATLDHIGEAIALVAAELNQRLCPSVVMHKVEVAMEELLVNVCSYAYAGQDAPGDVRVSYVYRADPHAITVELMDQGIPFNPVLREDPTKPSSIQEAKIGGLGIFMVKKTMDDLSYVYDGTNNIVAFRKSW